MPEGDSIYQSATRLRPVLEGQTLTHADARDLSVVRGLSGRTVLAVEPVGKHLLLGVDDDTTLRVHLGMKGSWRVSSLQERRPGNFDRVGLLLETARGRAVLAYPKVLERFRTRERPVHPVLSRLGPDLVNDPDPDWAEIVRRARDEGRGQREIGEVLLDQRVAAGIGNVYKCEVLFLERTSPFLPVDQLDDDKVLALYRRARELLLKNLEPGERNTTGRRSPALWVYGASRRGCARCGGRVSSEKQAGGALVPRVTWWCSRCQRTASPRSG